MNKSTNQTNHESLHQSTLPLINQSTIKTKRVQTLPGSLVITTHDIISLTFPPPYPSNANPQVTKKNVTIQHCFGGRGWGRKFEFFFFETYVLHWNFCLKFFNETFNVLCKNTPLRLLRGFVVSLEQEESQSHHSKLY